MSTLLDSKPVPERLTDTLQPVVDSIVRLTRADRVCLILSEDKSIGSILRGGPGWSDVATVGYDELMSGLVGWVLRTGEVALSPKGTPDLRESELSQQRRRQTNCGSVVVAPLLLGKTACGTIALIARPDEPDFTTDDAEWLLVYAQWAVTKILLHHAQEEAIQAQAERERAVRSKMSFLSNLSHELRTPLNGILGFSNLLDASELDANQRSMVQTILESGHRLLATVDNILELAQFESGQFHLEASPFSPRAVLDSVVGKFRAAAAEKGLEWKISVDAEVPSVVEGDAVRLGQAWSHVVSNAVKFTSLGSITAHLGVQLTKPKRCELVFNLEDTGIGLSGTRSGQWFSPFHQEDGSLTRKFGGTGLGLALCDRIARAMGGGLSLWGVPGVGTRARVWVDLGAEGLLRKNL